MDLHWADERPRLSARVPVNDLKARRCCSGPSLFGLPAGRSSATTAAEGRFSAVEALAYAPGTSEVPPARAASGPGSQVDRPVQLHAVSEEHRQDHRDDSVKVADELGGLNGITAGAR
ncbi:hypothetical protein predicted by Glimmer/Critica [Sorangium cellulosum So ce56]|uniref:Uncharacterized protein n=1 Tax=Sorangium cellulosum (strain So ce56) TaxID=448385 RepID=A9GDH4_SORC5|nr:hypothetical protein predicted by Glimmer/Critica [Sorangium cellulosum So ce56]